MLFDGADGADTHTLERMDEWIALFLLYLLFSYNPGGRFGRCIKTGLPCGNPDNDLL